MTLTEDKVEGWVTEFQASPGGRDLIVTVRPMDARTTIGPFLVRVNGPKSKITLDEKPVDLAQLMHGLILAKRVLCVICDPTARKISYRAEFFREGKVRK